jgi:hypothetical protein
MAWSSHGHRPSCAQALGVEVPQQFNDLRDPPSACPLSSPSCPACPSQATDVEVLQQFYESTLRALERTKNDRLWFKTNLKLASLWFKKAEYGRMSRILKELFKWVALRPEGDTQSQESGPTGPPLCMQPRLYTNDPCPPFSPFNPGPA